MQVKFTFASGTYDENLIPRRSSPGAAGFDLRAAQEVNVWPGESRLIPTGVALEIPRGWVGIIKSRSGLAVKEQIEVGAGVIDSDYRGEIKVLLRCFKEFPPAVKIEKYARIAQILFVPVWIEMGEGDGLVYVERLSDTDRGEGGFGSTGLK